MCDYLQLNPNYKAAIATLGALDRSDLDEMKSFRAPPELVKYVVYSLCLLFKVPKEYVYHNCILRLKLIILLHVFESLLNADQYT